MRVQIGNVRVSELGVFRFGFISFAIMGFVVIVVGCTGGANEGAGRWP